MVNINIHSMMLFYLHTAGNAWEKESELLQIANGYGFHTDYLFEDEMFKSAPSVNILSNQ